MATASSATNKRATRFGVWWAIAILLASLIITALASRFTKSEVDAVAKREFDFVCNEIPAKIQDRLKVHEQILRSGAAFYEASENVTRAEWHCFTERQKLDQQLPGVQGIGFALLIPRQQLARHVQDIRAEGFPEYHVRPEGQRETYSSIIYLEPFADRNIRAFGYDMLTESIRREAMERARDQDAAALSGKVVLVQETNKDVQAGTLMYMPVYRAGMPCKTVVQRRAAILGWVYSPYRMNDLMQGVLGGWDLKDNNRIHLKVFDGDRVSPETLLYDSQSTGSNEQVHPSALTLQTPIDSAGRRWTLCFPQSGGAAVAVDYSKVWFVLLGGASISLLLFGLSLSLLNTKRNAWQIARKLTAEYKQIEEALRQTTDRLSLAVRTGGVGIWDYDVASNRLIWDDQMFRLYGITREQFSGAYDAWQAGVHPEDRRRGDEEIQLALRGEKDFNTEFRVAWPDGSTHYIRALAVVQRNAAGQPLHMIGTNWDITTQKDGEAKQRENKLFLQETQRIARLCGWKANPHTDYLEWTDGVFEIIEAPSGRQPGLAEGLKFFLPEYIPTLKDYIARCLATGERFALECQGITGIGKTIWTEVRGFAPMADGGRTYVMGTFQDITERKRAEQALRESEANFRTFFESMTDMIMVCTPDGRVLFTNTAVTRSLGYRTEELVAMSVLDMHPANKRGEAEKIFAAMFRGERESCPLPLARKDGSLVPVETRVWFGRWNGENCLFGISKNLSAEVEAQQRFERLFRNNPALMALSVLPDHTFTDVNDAFLKVLGYSRSDILGKTAAELGLFTNSKQQAAMVDQLRANGRITDVEIQVRRKDKTVMTGLFSGEIISSQGWQYFLSVMIDITHQKQIEGELRESHNLLEKRVHERTTELSTINKALSAENDLRRAAEASLEEHQHNLRRLASQLTLAEEAQRHELAVQLHDTIGQELAMARLRLEHARGTSTHERERHFDVASELLDAAIGQVHTLTHGLGAGVLYQLGLPAAIRSVGSQVSTQHDLQFTFHQVGDYRRSNKELEIHAFRTVRELVYNVVKHAHASQLDIHLTATADTIEICVEDDGCGFLSEAGLKKNSDLGGGFGLFSIRERLAILGGRLELQSSPGQGTIALVTIPLLDGPPTATENGQKL